MVRRGGVIVWDDYCAWYPGVVRHLHEIAERWPVHHLEGTHLAILVGTENPAEELPSRTRSCSCAPALKRARKGKDIGKRGKNFSKIEARARYSVARANAKRRARVKRSRPRMAKSQSKQARANRAKA